MPGGPGVRVDTAAEAGDRVPPEYDNLLAKVMVHGADRASTIDRLAGALREMEIAGIQTTLPFHRFVADHSAFKAAELSTGWVADHWDGPAAAARAGRLAQLVGALAATWTDGRNRGDGLDGRNGSAWATAALEAAVDRSPGADE
jgi:acetyl/propionyl-CoA carboxylase alpha subunit